MSKFKVTIVVQEVSDDPEAARGVRFSEDVDAEDLYDYFSKSRDAVDTLFHGKPRMMPAEDVNALRVAIAAEKARAALRQRQIAGIPAKPKPSNPAPAQSLDEAFMNLMNDAEDDDYKEDYKKAGPPTGGPRALQFDPNTMHALREVLKPDPGQPIYDDDKDDFSWGGEGPTRKQCEEITKRYG